MLPKIFLVFVIAVAIGSQLRAIRLLKRRLKIDKVLGTGILVLCLSIEATCVSVLALGRPIDDWSPTLRGLIWGTSLLGAACIISALVISNGNRRH